MFGHSAWMARTMKGCYVDDGGASGGGVPEDNPNLDTDDTDPFDNFNFNLDDEDEEPENDPEAKPDPEKGDPEDNAGQDDGKSVRTSKQDPEFDALAARTRRAEEELARLRFEREQQIREASAAAEKNRQHKEQSKYEQMWGATLQYAEKLKKEGYDEVFVNNYVETQRSNILLQQRVDQAEQRLVEFDQRNQQLTQKQQGDAIEKAAMDEYKTLKSKHGDMLPEDAKNLSELLHKLDDETRGYMLQYGLPLEKAFRLAHGDKLTAKEKSLAEKRTVANIQDRNKRTVETNKAEPKPEDTLTKREMSLAKAFGVPPSEVAKRSNPKLRKGVS